MFIIVRILISVNHSIAPCRNVMMTSFVTKPEVAAFFNALVVEADENWTHFLKTQLINYIVMACSIALCTKCAIILLQTYWKNSILYAYNAYIQFSIYANREV